MAQAKKKSTGSSAKKKAQTKGKKNQTKNTNRTNSTKSTGSGRGSGTSKTTGKSGTATSSRNHSAAGTQGIRTETIFFVTLLVCVMLLLSNFSLLGSLGGYLRTFQFGLFGTAAYFLPIYIGGVWIYLSLERGIDGYLAPMRIVAAIVLPILLCAMIGLLGGNGLGQGEVYTLQQCYEEATLGISGGVFGGLVYLNLNKVIGVVGTYAVLLILLFFSGVVLRGKPVFQPMHRSAERMRERAEQQRRYNEEEAEVARQEEELRWEEEELARREAYRQLEERRNDLEQRRTELRARSLAFGEATKLDPPDADPDEGHEDTEMTEKEEDLRKKRKTSGNESDGNEGSSDLTTESRAKRKRRVVTEEAFNESEDTSASEGLKVGEVNGRQRKRTLRELEALDRYDEEDQESVSSPPSSEDLLPDLVIHGANLSSDTDTADEQDTTVTTSGRNSLSHIVEEEELLTLGESEGTTVSDAETDGYAVPPAQNTNPVTHRHPAAKEFSEEEAMEAYEEFKDAPDPEAVLRGEIPSSTAPAKKSGKSAFSTSGGSVWADQSNISSNSGRIFHGSASAEDETESIEIQPEAPVVKKEYEFPALSLLNRPKKQAGTSEKQLRETAQKLQQTLSNFGVGAKVTDLSCGPTVTRYELSPDQGVKVRRIVDLADDIKLNLAASDIRIEAPIPGKAAVGIEVPNEIKQTVSLTELIDSDEFRRSPSKVSFGVGKDIGGKVIAADLARMPHLLIAGATGSGKSVCINSIIVSILYKAHPDEVKLIMIDPKVVELSVYNGIPHLLIPVVTDPKKAAGALNWAVQEMTDRYKRFADTGCRDIKGFNKMVEERDDGKYEKMPQIVVIVDELADLMMVAAGEVEEAICRLAQLARAAGIHLVLATQRPSVNVITGLIKANVPSRIAFAVSSGTDSRTILDMNGAEKLLGYGDMLFYPSGYPKPVRIQGAFVSDEEVQRIVEFLKEQGQTDTERADTITRQMNEISHSSGAGSGGDRDDLFEQAGRYIIEAEKASIGNLQRKFRIGFNRAARIMDQLCDYGVVGPEEGTKARQIIMTMEQFNELIEQI